MTLFPRSSGILLHPTSLPGRYGIGDLGPQAYRFLDFLAETGTKRWPILPLGPPGYGDSPYQTLSAFAGNPNLVSLDTLVSEGWLTSADLKDVPAFPAEYVDFGWIIGYHDQKLTLAYQRFTAKATASQKAAFEKWCAEHDYWLDDFALFAAIKDSHGGRPWVEWPEGEALRQPQALDAARAANAVRIGDHRFRQWMFHRQWFALKQYANDRGIRLFGDLPIFVAHDSADVWANRDLFYLDAKGQPTVIAGVPPDYFSPTGQRWGNPLYRWDIMQKNGYAWWIRRFKAILSVVDYIRIDHFRGFEAYWEIPASEETAINGEWMPGPRHDFFLTVKEALGELPIIAEDLGVITEGVESLRNDFELPGMKVLQFAWGSGPKNPFLPHNHVENCVVYSGTHDNNTTIGWWETEATAEVRRFIADYLGGEIVDPAWTFMVVGMRSAAHTFILPMQDVMHLNGDSRMNTPGKESGNWTWRFTPEMMSRCNGGLAHITWLYQRRADQQEKEYGDVAVQGD